MHLRIIEILYKYYDPLEFTCREGFKQFKLMSKKKKVKVNRKSLKTTIFNHIFNQNRASDENKRRKVIFPYYKACPHIVTTVKACYCQFVRSLRSSINIHQTLLLLITTCFVRSNVT